MPKYHFNVRDERGLSVDDEGNDFALLGEALDEAKASARDLAKQLLDDRRQIDDSCVEITDSEGNVLAVLPVSEVMRHPNFPKFRDEC